MTISVTTNTNLYRLQVQSCATVTLSPDDTTTFPKTLTLNFGTSYVGSDWAARSGEIIYTLSGKFGNAGITVTVTFNNYSVDSYGMQGSYSITNTSISNAASWITQITNGKITYPDNSYYLLPGKRSVTQISGTGESNSAANVYSIVGSNTFSSSAGQILKDSITTACIKANSCNWISQRIITFTYDGVSGTLNYGNGNCDNAGTVTVGTISNQVTL